MPTSTALRFLGILLLGAVVAACGSDAAAPDDALRVNNNTDDFSFDLKDVPDYSGTLRYQWSNSGTAADIDIEVAAASGIGTLTIQDADNKTVFSRDVKQGGSFVSDTGRSGTWTITVILVRVAGPYRFRVVRH